MWFHPALAVQKEINNIKYSDIKCIVLEYIYIWEKEHPFDTINPGPLNTNSSFDIDKVWVVNTLHYGHIILMRLKTNTNKLYLVPLS